jgi:crossover junction endodeoxyribonuclease RusA
MMLVLPCPPSMNHYWRTWRGRVVKSEEGREYQRKVALLAKSQLERGARPLAGLVEVEVSVYRPQRRGDLDNFLKVLLDSLKGIAFVDDSQVIRIEARRYDDAKNPRAVLSVKEAA